MINIDELTYGQLKQIAAEFSSQPGQPSTKFEVKRKVIVRSYGAGVFFGTLAARNGQEVVLENCRRVWSWKGAKTLSELALHGPGPGSNISETTPRHEVLEVIEIIDAQVEAISKFEAAKWGA